MQEIAPGIFVESRYPPYNVGLIMTDHGAVVVDVPPRPSHAWAWHEQVEQVAGKPRYAILTDATLERQIAAALWPGPLIAATATLRAIAAYDEREWREMLQAYGTQYPEETDEFARLRPSLPTLACDVRMLLHYCTPPIEMETVAGAAPGSLWVTLANRGVLFAGDTICVDEPPPLEVTPDSKGWLDTLSTLARRTAIHQIVPGRGQAPIQRGGIEPQREFLRVMRHTAHTLVNSNHSRLAQCAQDLGQAFYNAKGQKAVRRIRLGLEHFIAELQQDQAAPERGE